MAVAVEIMFARDGIEKRTLHQIDEYPNPLDILKSEIRRIIRECLAARRER